MKPLDFSAASIEKLLRGLDTTKSCGPDDLSARFLQSLSSELSPALELLFYTNLQQGKLPRDWSVLPIFKKGNKSNAENYRPVSLTSIICKIAEHIIVSQMYDHLDLHHVFTDAQHGFRKKRSTATQLLLMTNDFMSGQLRKMSKLMQSYWPFPRPLTMYLTICLSIN